MIEIMKKIKTTPSDQCRAGGLRSLAELSRLSGVSVQTLINWSRNKPTLFEIAIAGAKAKKELTE